MLRIDLSTGGVHEQQFDDGFARQYIGASGFAAKLLWDETGPFTDPLGPGNLFIMAIGPLSGTMVPNSGRNTVAAKSPLTGSFGEGSAGGSWGWQLRRTPYDAVVIRGRARGPSYVWIEGDEMEIRDASHIWGMDTFETNEALLEETDKDATVACCGPAAETGVLFSGVFADGVHARTVARCGLGAVMGSKNLKAVVARGTIEREIAHPEEFKSNVKEGIKKVAENTRNLTLYGTAMQVEVNEEVGDLPLQDWTQRSWEKGNSYEMSGINMRDTVFSRNYGCKGCPTRCGRVVKMEDGREIGGPEYETIGMLGTNCMLSDMRAMTRVNELVNRLGMDSISAGQVCAFAIEAYERGLVSEEDVGMPLYWGDEESISHLLKIIARRELIGDTLALGVMRAAERIKAPPEMHLHVKGLEIPAHDPRAYSSLAIEYATAVRGADHLSGLTHDHQVPHGAALPALGYDEPMPQHQRDGIVKFVIDMQNVMSLYDSLHVCKFLQFGEVDIRSDLLTWYNQITGLDLSFNEFIQAGERVFNLKRMYNVREGVRRGDDTIPQRFVTHMRKAPKMMDWELVRDLESQLDEYYALRGWTQDGVPTESKLRELNLHFAVEAARRAQPAAAMV